VDIAQIAATRYTTKAFDPAKTIPAPLIAQLRTALRLSPSSVNSQPWHFFLAASTGAKARIAKAMQGGFAYNEPKVLNASHVVVLCARKMLDDGHLEAIIEQEQRDGRFPTPEARANQNKSRRFYVNLHREEWKDEPAWIERQVYLALGTLLFAAGALNIDACTMEGFDAAVLDRELELADKGLRSLVVVALGYRGEGDFNAKLPKSRLPAEQLFTEL